MHGVSVSVKDDGTWLNFTASTGRSATIHVEHWAEQRGHIVGAALLDWANDQRAALAKKERKDG